MKRLALRILALGLTFSAQVALADWGAVKRLTWTADTSGIPSIAAYLSGSLHVVWYDSTPGNLEIYYKNSTDGGDAWSTSKRLTWTSGKSWMPAIAADSSGNLYVVWFDDTPGNYEIYYKKSTDGGATWSTGQRLTFTSGWSESPDIAVDPSGNLHLVWWDDVLGNNEIYYKKSTDGGATWTPNKRLTWTPEGSGAPAIAVDSSAHLHVVWVDSPTGNYEIYYKKSTDGGATWSTNKRLTWTSGNSTSPAMAIDTSAHLHVVWQSNPALNDEIYYRKSTDGGATWTPKKRLTWNSTHSDHPNIAVDLSNNIHLVWEDGELGEPDIFYKMSTDGGTIWTANKRLTWTSGDSEYPVIAVDFESNLHVAWQDDTPGNNEIYYRKFIK